MEIVILGSAYKHGITDESIYSCLFNCRADIMMEVSPPKRLVAGFDHKGIPLEIIALEETEHKRLVVIHAMKLQKKYYHLLQEGTNEL
ncbi:MAG: hypothetical protein LBF63_04760 [Treponema sp.]|jgi:hypothetical protein|nr:hypothetical protein [Treponema sp.]